MVIKVMDRTGDSIVVLSFYSKKTPTSKVGDELLDKIG